MASKTLTAFTPGGSELPILDLTAPAFSLPDADDLAVMESQYIEDSSRQTEPSGPLLQALQDSLLGSALLASARSYLAGLPTYLLKLGPENLSPDASSIDRRIAASFPAICARQRLADVARLTASGVLRTAEAYPNRPLCLVNIGGGAAADSWNTLLLAQRDSPDLLKARIVNVAIFDPDADGPAFAVNAFRRLSDVDAPLHGLDIRVSPWAISWSQLQELREALASLSARNSICAISSEGALFEYGSDEEIRSALNALESAVPEESFFVGSVTRSGACAEAARHLSRTATRPRSIEAFTELTASGGWRLDEYIPRPFSYQVRLRKAMA